MLGFTAGYIRDSQDLLLGFDCGSQNSEKTFTWFEKDLTQEWPDGRDAQSKVWGRSLGLSHPLWAGHAPQSPGVQQLRSSPNPILLGFYGGFTIKAWWRKSLTSASDWTSSPSPPSRGRRWDWKSQASNHLVDSPSKQSSSFCCFQSLSHVRLFATPWTAAHQASLSFTISQSLLKVTSIESVMPSNHFILCRPLLLLPSIFPSIRVFSN